MIKTRIFDPEKRYKTSYMARTRSAISRWVYGHNKPPEGVIPEIGCTIEDLRFHIENQFIETMSWRNVGQWNIDHIEPCFWFCYDYQPDVFRCNHWSNFRPIWAEDNFMGTPKSYDSRPLVPYKILKDQNPRDFWAKIRGQAGQGKNDINLYMIFLGDNGDRVKT